MPRRSYKKVRIMARGDILKHARIERGFSAQTFAVAVGVSKQQVYMVEKGTSGISEAAAVRMAKALGRDFKELFEIVWPEKDDPSPIDRPAAGREALFVAPSGGR